MRKYLKFHGVNIENGNGLPTFLPSPESAMAAMPEGYWNVLFDPDQIEVSPAKALERVSNNLIDNIGASTMPIDSFPNGATAFDPDASEFIGFNPNRAVDPNNWTVFTVVTGRETETLTDIVNSVSDSNSSPDLGFRITLSTNANNLNVYEPSGRDTGTTIRLQHDDFGIRANPSLLMVTFSTQRGLSIWDNGTQVAFDGDDKRPLEVNFGAGEWRVFWFARHLFGLTGQLNADLGQTGNAVYRRMIERHCKEKYNIAAIAA